MTVDHHAARPFHLYRRPVPPGADGRRLAGSIRSDADGVTVEIDPTLPDDIADGIAIKGMVTARQPYDARRPQPAPAPWAPSFAGIEWLPPADGPDWSATGTG